MKVIADADYAQAKRFCKYFEIKHLGDYHVIYFQSDTSFLADVLGNF